MHSIQWFISTLHTYVLHKQNVSRASQLGWGSIPRSHRIRKTNSSSGSPQGEFLKPRSATEMVENMNWKYLLEVLAGAYYPWSHTSGQQLPLQPPLQPRPPQLLAGLCVVKEAPIFFQTWSLQPGRPGLLCVNCPERYGAGATVFRKV